MSLVGPRPESPERVKHYSDWQRNRLLVVPGLTGLAQVQGLRDRHPSEQKARFDMQYILHWSPFLDLVLVVQTAWTLVVRAYTLPSAPSAVSAQQRRASAALDSRSLIPEVARADRSQPYAD
jgi:lipopolysaccharide/colanic/teichoic acid biosynthesis glycosyltransferase